VAVFSQLEFEVTILC